MQKRSDAQNQEFKKRFEGRTNKIDKDGYMGIIAGKGEPIHRQPGSVAISETPVSSKHSSHQALTMLTNTPQKSVAVTPSQGPSSKRKLSENLGTKSISKAGSMIIQSGSATPIKLNSLNTSDIQPNIPLYNRMSYQFDSPQIIPKKSPPQLSSQKTNPVKVLPERGGQVSPQFRKDYHNSRSHLHSNPPPHHYLKEKIDVTPHRTKVNRKQSYDGKQRSQSTKLPKSDKSQLVEIGYREINMSYHALPGGQPPMNFLSPEFLQSHDKNLKNLNYVAKQFSNATNKMSGGQRRTNSYSNPYDARQQQQQQQHYPSNPGPIRVQDEQNLTSSAFSVKSTISHYRPQQRVSPAVAILQEYQNKGKYYELGGLGPYNIGTENWKAGKARQKAMTEFSNNIRKGGSVREYASVGKYSSFSEDYQQSYSHQRIDYGSPVRHQMGGAPPPPIRRNHESTFAPDPAPRMSRLK